MNLSGHAVRYLSSELGVPPENVVVIYDEISIPLGGLRIK